MKTHVWGIGLTRTGTHSLSRALEILGYNCIHYPTLATLLHEPLEAATDEPVAVVYKYLDFLYPGSKFILTFRQEDEWLQSAAAHRRRHFERLKGWTPFDSPFSSREESAMHAKTATILGQSLARDRAVERAFTQMTLYETVEYDEALFRAGYKRHHEDVFRYFARRPADLLVLRICEGEGWSKLCDFLGHEVPAAEFPMLNVKRPVAR